MTFGERLLQVLQKRKITQQKFSALCGLCGPMISLYVRGKRYPHKKGMPLLAKALGPKDFWFVLIGD